MKRSLFLLALFLLAPPFSNPARAELRAGAAVVDVTPKKLPVLVNGGMLSRSLDKVNTPVNARALALSDGKTTLAIVVVDSCMMPRPLLDEAKALAAQKTGIPADHLLMSATHTHSAPSCMGALGTDPDPEYVPFLREKLVEAVAAALANLKPARAMGMLTIKVEAPDEALRALEAALDLVLVEAGDRGSTETAM